MINYNAVINNNYGRIQILVLLFKIPLGMGKDFYEIYWQFGTGRQNVSPAPV